MLIKLLFLFFIIPSLSYANVVQISQDSLLASGLKALKNNNIDNAIHWRKKLIPHSLNSDILAWAIALTNLKNTPSQELSYALENLSNWPQQNVIKANYERTVYNELLKGTPFVKKKYDIKPYLSKQVAKNFITFFNNNLPQTTQGIAIYIGSAIITKKLDKALPFLRNVWRHKKLPPDEQNIILASSDNLLSPIDNLNRLRMLLLHASYDSALQLAPLTKSKALAKCFIKTLSDKKNSKNNLSSLKKLDNYGILYQYAYVRKAIEQKDFTEAANQLLKLPHEKTFLISPNIWAHLHLSLAHDLVYANKPLLAYKIIDLYRNENKIESANREFYAGWIALRKLYKPITAIKHFMNIKKYNKNSHFIAKANYWIARSYEDIKNYNLAKIYYKKSAIFNSSFYGQLSAEHLKQHKPIFTYPIVTNKEKNNFNAIEAVQALKKLQYLDNQKYTRLLSLSLAKKLNNKEHLAFLASMAASNSDYYAALKIAKIAVSRGFDMGILTYPLGVISNSSHMSLNEKAIIYAIARQESEFNSNAISKVGARGLMQLMPNTAQELSQKLMQKFSLTKLSTNASYNALLGGELLRRQLKDFKGSYLLTFTAYNAGKYRVNQWVEKYKDPRGLALKNVLDWIENIPYSETRNYTKRVFENYEIYKTILKGTSNLSKDLTI